MNITATAAIKLLNTEYGIQRTSSEIMERIAPRWRYVCGISPVKMY
jgi:hypothetical protein